MALVRLCCYHIPSCSTLTKCTVNVGLLAFAGRKFYTKPHLLTNARALGTVAATVVTLLGVEGALAEAYAQTEAGKTENIRAKKEGPALYRQIREAACRPGVQAGVAMGLSLGSYGGFGYAVYLTCVQRRQDRRAEYVLWSSAVAQLLAGGCVFVVLKLLLKLTSCL